MNKYTAENVPSKRRTAIARTARLNMLIDAGRLEPEGIVSAMDGKVNLKFVNNIIAKRRRNDNPRT